MATKTPENLTSNPCTVCDGGELSFTRSDRSDRRLVWTFTCDNCGRQEQAEIALPKTDPGVPDATGPE